MHWLAPMSNWERIHHKQVILRARLEHSCSRLRPFTVSHQRTSPTCVNQWHQLAADRDCDLPLVVTSSSAQLSRTLAPGHFLLQNPKPGIIFQRTYVRLTLSVPLKLHWRHSCSVDYVFSLDTSRPCNRFHVTGALEIVSVIIIIIVQIRDRPWLGSISLGTCEL